MPRHFGNPPGYVPISANVAMLRGAEHPLSAFARYRRAMLWNLPQPGETPENLADFLLTLQKGPGAHGGPFAYASPNSDVLGLLIERVTGARFADLFETLLWQPMGARNDGYVTVDAIGTPRTAGGMCVTARDLARVGELLRTGGAVGGRQVVPERWIDDMTAFTAPSSPTSARWCA